MDHSSLYGTDILAWSEDQAASLRRLAQRCDLPDELDLDNIAEEIESVGRSELSSVQSLIRQVFVHMIKAALVEDATPFLHGLEESVAFQAMR